MSLASISVASRVTAAALIWALTPSARAAEVGAKPSAVASQGAPLALFVDASGQAFDAQKLRVALSRELGREITLTSDASAAAVRVKLESASRAQVRYTTPSGKLLDRDVELPPDRERSVEVVSWLTVNLVRDEASELIDALRARRKEEELRALAEQEATERAAERAAADRAAAEQAAKRAADEAAVEAARQRAERSQLSLPPTPSPAPPLLRDLRKSFDLALATPLSIVPDSPKRELRLQLALGYGDAGGLRGAALTPSVLRVRRDVQGAVVAAAAGIVSGNVRGALVSAGYAHVEGTVDGVQIGAGAAVQRGKLVRGAVVSAGGVIASDVQGAVVGVGFASARSLVGAGVAGGVTFIRGPVDGALVAGGVNFSTDLRGVELAGGVNVARDISGVALAPVNVHRNVKGVQIGVINVAEDVDGLQIGALSFSKNGRFQPMLWGSSDGSAHVALKSISGYGFTQLGAGINVDAAQLSYDGGIGAHLALSQSIFLEPGVHYSGVHATERASGGLQQHRLHFLALFGWRVGDKLDLLAGGGVRQTIVGNKGFKPEVRAGVAFF